MHEYPSTEKQVTLPWLVMLMCKKLEMLVTFALQQDAPCFLGVAKE